MATHFSLESMEERKKWHTIFKALTEKNCQHRILYPVDISFRMKVKYRYPPMKENLDHSLAADFLQNNS